MWNGNAAILNPKPAKVAMRPSVSSGSRDAIAFATPARSVVPVAPYTKERPYAMTADETAPTRKNFSDASTAIGSRLAKPAST
jgi:hypothetical protein